MTTSRSFLLICTVGIFSFISYNMVRMPALSLFAESLGASPERIGLIVSVSTLTGVLLKLPSGALSDIYGRRLLLRIGVVAFGLPPFLYPFITDLDALTALRFVHGLATAIFAPSALATVGDQALSENQALARLEFDLETHRVCVFLRLARDASEGRAACGVSI